MPARSPLHVAVGQYAAAVRWDKPDKEEAARRLAAARIEDYVARVVAEAPPLSPEQAARISSLLRGAA